MTHRTASIFLLSLFAACSSDSATPPAKKTPYEPFALPRLVDARTTLDRIIIPSHAIAKPPENRVPSEVADRAAMIRDGFDAFTYGPGEPVLANRAPPDMIAPPPGPNAKLLTRFVHMPDLQLVDDESPARFVPLDAPVETGGAFRPQEADVCRLVNAAVRTINALHGKSPIEFLLLGGDNADNAQRNEVSWVLDVLGGSPRLECDSGDDDDPVPGPGNDGKDPFVAEGLAMPFYWVTGNHDILVNGTFPIDDSRRFAVVQNTSVWGTRDWREPGGPIRKENLIADLARQHVSRTELMQRVASHGNGHGLGAPQIESGKANYTFDIASGPIRFVILDTAAETGSSEGVVRRGDLEGFIRPTLDRAFNEGKIVVLASHHAITSITDGGEYGGDKQDDAVSRADWLAFLGGYPNVLFSMVGHSHRHRIRYQAPPFGHGFWEVTSSAIADFPQQFRVVELWDDDNGWIRLRSVVVDYEMEGDDVGIEGKKLGALDMTSGWTADGRGTAADRNVDISIPKP